MKTKKTWQTGAIARVRLIQTAITSTAVIALAACGGTSDDASPATFTSQASLGEALFSDVNLSLNRTQSCSTCHDPEHAFVDARVGDDGKVLATSLGDDGISLGDRNTPTAAYARLTPEFHQGSHGRFNSQQPDYMGFIGGQFLDGRETDLKGQASGPPLNPVEMGMPDKASVVARLLENSDYVESFKRLFGEDIFDDPDATYAALTSSIGEFEKTDAFAPFTSKYDKSLAGDFFYDPLSKAALGKSLFFSQQFTNCATCHQLKANGSSGETFSNYEYHNLGVPVNASVRELNGAEVDFVDNGLFDNASVNDETQKGKFKVPTLRNVAVTAPYMHNGVFRDLTTVLKFYDHYITGSPYTLNPETGASWREPEVADTVALTELQDGRSLDEDEIEAIGCFLATLTDEQYEHLIPVEWVERCGF